MEKSGRVDADSANKEMNGTNKEIVQPSYKTLPDGDANWDSNKDDKLKMSKQNGTENDIDDGAQEKMLKDDTKAMVTPVKNSAEVKFGSSNGDTKIDMEVVKQTLSGMGKEELMKYANDPFWVRLRWFLFVAFWVLWFAMLAGAIAIIVLAPKCAGPEPRKYWEESPLLELELSNPPNNDFKRFNSLLDAVYVHNIKTISLPSILKASRKGHIIDFYSIDEKLGEISDLENLIKAAKNRTQHIILEFDPNHSSIEHEWFAKSVKREDPYTDYYVWANGTVDGNDSPFPNNWRNEADDVAWEFNLDRKQYYFHQFNASQPDLNFNNPLVVEEFEKIFKFWLSLGVSGFRLANTRFLTENPNLEDEKGTMHKQTVNRVENREVLKKWRAVVNNHTNNDGLFALKDDIGADILQVFNEKEQLIDLPQSPQFLLDKNLTAESLNKSIPQWLSQSKWPSWNVNGKRDLGQQELDSLMLMMMLLPGTPIVRLNNTFVKPAFTILSKCRSELAFLYGDTQTYAVHNNTVFVYTRLKSGNPGYLVLYHTGEESVVVDLSTTPKVSEELTIVTFSPNYVHDTIDLKSKIPAKEVPMSPKSTLVLTFVPQ